MVSISGEPGIGKTSLVRRFAGDLDDGRVLIGTCDDLSIPRPLGPFRDLAEASRRSWRRRSRRMPRRTASRIS